MRGVKYVKTQRGHWDSSAHPPCYSLTAEPLFTSILSINFDSRSDKTSTSTYHNGVWSSHGSGEMGRGGGAGGGGIKRCLSSAEVLMPGLEESISLLLLSRGSVGRLSHSYSSDPLFTLSVTLWPCHLFTSVVFSHSHVSLFSGLFSSVIGLHVFTASAESQWVFLLTAMYLWMIVIQTNQWWKSPFLMDGWQLGGFKCKLIWVLNLPYWLLILYIKIIDPRRDLRPWTAFLKTANSQLILVIRKKTCSKEIVQTAILVCVSFQSHFKFSVFCVFLWGLPLFRAVAVCHLRWQCQVPRARACDWIPKSSLEALFSYSSMQTRS